MNIIKRYQQFNQYTTPKKKMKILIVNFYKNSPKGNKKYQNYQRLVKEMVLSQKIFPDTETHFFIRDKNNLGDVLYEIGSQYKNKNNMNFFQNLDFIFMEGDSSILPWHNHYDNAHILLRMCLNYNKKCFVSGGLANCIIYQASDRIRGYKPIVHCDRNIEELFHQLIPNQQLQQNDYFVESATGDVYQLENNYIQKINDQSNNNFDKKDEIIQKGNLGLHKEKDAEDNSKMGKFVIKSNVYRDSQQYGEKLVVARITEELIYIHKKYNCHYLLNQLPHQMIVNTDNRKWNVHPFVVQNHQFRFEIIAESAKSKTSILQMVNNPNMFILFFVVDQIYHSTYSLMKNFFTEKITEMGFNKAALTPVKMFNFNRPTGRSLKRIDSDHEHNNHNNNFLNNSNINNYNNNNNLNNSMINNYNHMTISPLSNIRSGGGGGKQSPYQKNVLENSFMQQNETPSLQKKTLINFIGKDVLATTNINQPSYSHVTQYFNDKSALQQLTTLSRTLPINTTQRTEMKSLSPFRSRNVNHNYIKVSKRIRKELKFFIQTIQIKGGRDSGNKSFQNNEDRVFVHQGVNPFDSTRNSRLRGNDNNNTLIETSTLFTTRRGKETLQKTPKQIRDISLIKEKITFNKKLMLISDVSLDQFQQFQNKACPKVVSQNRPFMNLKKYNNQEDEEGYLQPYISVNEHKYRDESPNKWVGSPWRKI